MTTKIVYRNGKSGFVSGLSWYPLLADGKKRAAEIRALIAESDAQKIVIYAENAHTQLGLATIEDDGDESKTSKFFSLAAAFASLVGQSNAVLAYQLPNSAQVAIILVESGRPVLDDVKSAEEVQSMAASYSSGSTGFVYALYTNNLDLYSAGEYVDDETLWKYADKRSMLVGKPVNTKALISLLVTVVVIVASGVGYSQYSKVQARKELIRKQEAENPVPKYQAALAPRLGSMGMDAAALIELMRVLGTQPMRSVGWRLKSIECTTASNQCLSTWVRSGGTTDALIEARKAYNEEILGSSTVDETRFALKLPLTLSGVAARMDLPEAGESTVQSTPIYQTLANAGVELKVPAGGYQTWPVVPGITTSALPRNVVVQARGAEFMSSMPLVNQTLLSLPKNFWWTDLTIAFADASTTALDSMKVSVKGNSYVR